MRIQRDVNVFLEAELCTWSIFPRLGFAPATRSGGGEEGVGRGRGTSGGDRGALPGRLAGGGAGGIGFGVLFPLQKMDMSCPYQVIDRMVPIIVVF